MLNGRADKGSAASGQSDYSAMVEENEKTKAAT
jgi:hypothetical protein